MTHDELVNMVMEKHRNNPLQAASLIIVLGMPESEVTAYFEKGEIGPSLGEARRAVAKYPQFLKAASKLAASLDRCSLQDINGEQFALLVLGCNLELIPAGIARQVGGDVLVTDLRGSKQGNRQRQSHNAWWQFWKK